MVLKVNFSYFLSFYRFVVAICDLVPKHSHSLSRGTTWSIFSYSFFCFVVAICNLVHDVEAIFKLP